MMWRASQFISMWIRSAPPPALHSPSPRPPPMPPPMALPLSSATTTLRTLPPFRPCLPAALRLPTSRARARAVSAGYAASFYGGSASAAGSTGDKEVGDEEGSAARFGAGLGLGGGGLGMSAAEAALVLEEREMPPCPPGLRQYETMVVLRPDMSEEERLALIQRYEELLVAGGAMYVEVFNRGVIPLAYSIRKRNSRTGLPSTYYDGIYLLVTYFTKPESLDALQQRLNADDDVIRSTSFKVRKRKAF
ncbi:small ribosomal subunit protein bS6c-like [Phragmites australis]|uniref:small ribosomal subunit protein bS6c-like n=1 Tax=Phragmites australis TaxID=29695 RepID=UPI002D78CEE4|nr:small ribosomal subunit protein bS6c-like [Phragmites australis]